MGVSVLSSLTAFHDPFRQSNPGHRKKAKFLNLVLTPELLAMKGHYHALYTRQFSTQADEGSCLVPSFASRVAGVLIYAAIGRSGVPQFGRQDGGSVAWDHGRSGRPEALGMCGRRKREPVRQAQARVSSHSHDVVPS